MKNTLYLFALVLIFSCGGDEEINNIPVVEETIKKTDLSQFELPFIIQTEKIEDENGVPLNVDVTHDEGELDWELRLGSRFNIVIEDYGDEQKNAITEIKHQQELEQFFDYTYITETEKTVVYSKAIPGDTLNTQHHFYAVKEVGEGYYYTIQSNPAENFTLEEINKMLEASKSLISIDQLAL
jgi:hypothetical protein